MWINVRIPAITRLTFHRGTRILHDPKTGEATTPRTLAMIPIDPNPVVAVRVVSHDAFGKPALTLPYTRKMLLARWQRGDDIPEAWEWVFNRTESAFKADGVANAGKSLPAEPF